MQASDMMCEFGSCAHHQQSPKALHQGGLWGEMMKPGPCLQQMQMSLQMGRGGKGREGEGRGGGVHIMRRGKLEGELLQWDSLGRGICARSGKDPEHVREWVGGMWV